MLDPPEPPEQILDRLMCLQSKLSISLQQRLSRLMASKMAFSGVVSGVCGNGCRTGGASPPPGPSTAVSTAHDGFSVSLPPPPELPTNAVMSRGLTVELGTCAALGGVKAGGGVALLANRDKCHQGSLDFIVR